MGLRGGDEVDGANVRERGLVPFTAAYAAAVARERLDGGDPDGAVAALWLGTRGASRVPGEARYLLAEAVIARPRLVRLALRVALSGGGAGQRLAAGATVLGASLGLWQTRTSNLAAACAGGLPRSVSSQRRETFWLSEP